VLNSNAFGIHAISWSDPFHPTIHLEVLGRITYQMSNFSVKWYTLWSMGLLYISENLSSPVNLLSTPHYKWPSVWIMASTISYLKLLLPIFQLANYMLTVILVNPWLAYAWQFSMKVSPNCYAPVVSSSKRTPPFRSNRNPRVPHIYFCSCSTVGDNNPHSSRCIVS
jgi:hypothetical protein